MRNLTIYIITLVLSVLSTSYAKGQIISSVNHYLTEDGLSHNLINQIIQDKRGFVWLATYNGLCKFDGYTFSQYLPQTSDSLILKNNRIDGMTEDAYGRIWLQSSLFIPKIYCFDPEIKKFKGNFNLKDNQLENFNISQIVASPTGLVWWLSDNNGCICVTDSAYSTIHFCKSENNFNADAVYKVFEDKENNTWLMTNNGLTMFPKNDFKNPVTYFDQNSNNPLSFHSSLEINDEIWFGGAAGMIAKYSKSDKSFRVQKLPLYGNVDMLYALNNHSVLATTYNKGFCTIGIFTGDIKIYDSTKYPGLDINRLHPITVTNGYRFWFFNNDKTGVFLFDFNTEKLHFLPGNIPSKLIATKQSRPYVLTDSKEQIWVQPPGGCFSLFDADTNTLIPLKPKYNNQALNFSNYFHLAFFDNQDNLWFNSYGSGLGKIVFSNNNFKSLTLKNKTHSPLNNDIRAIYQLKSGYIAVANKNNQILLLNNNLEVVNQLTPDGRLAEKSVWEKPAYNFMEDLKGNLWIATRGDGIFMLTPKDNSGSYTVNHFKNDPGDKFSLSDNDVYTVFEDSKGHIWAGTLNGLNLVSFERDEIKFMNMHNKFSIAPGGKRRIRCINETPGGLLCVGSMEGLLVFDSKTDDFKNIPWKLYEKQLAPDEGLASNDVIDICITKKQEVFIATSYGGITKVDSVDNTGFPIKFKTYSVKDGLPSNNILSMVEDLSGNLWIATDFQICRFDPVKDIFELFPETKALVHGKNFAEATRYCLNSGEVLFGYSDGIVHFFPDQIKTNNYAPYLSLTELRVFNQDNKSGNQSTTHKNLDNQKHITLSKDENFFHIEYAALDYKNPANIKYAYKLDGFDKYWNYVEGQRTAIYTNVPKGDYVFEVKSTNSQGVWTDNQKALPITIRPSFWETPWAYTLYIFIILLLLLIINFTIITIYKLKTSIRFEKSMSGMRQKFFIDISHEIRTPLTMITAPVEYLINDNRTPENVKNQLQHVAQSSGRLLRLVNQILDFRKIQELKPSLQQIDLGVFVKDICNDFTEIAIEQNITFSVTDNSNHASIWADKNSLDKITMNLLSNAFKFTPAGKQINVYITEEDKYVSLTIADEGTGINKNILNKLFTRFVSFSEDANKPSTGIGLSIVKTEADKHNAKVLVQSEPEKGSIFTVQFKKGTKHFSGDVEFLSTDTPSPQELESKLEIIEATAPDKKPTVLIVEDDADLRLFIKSIIENNYEVLMAEDGETGFQTAKEQSPDFIVSDIMMPKLNGIELLKKLRNDISTSHIPIILLTAKTNIESKLEGLTYGADDYITKPFSVPYFQARIENLMAQRRRLHEIFSKGERIDTEVKEYNPKPSLITNQDEEIMENIISAIENNMDNSDFSVEDMASAIGLNRTTMFYKIKSLAGQSPVEFIRDIRLKRAAQLIGESQLLIKEIAFMTGFQDIKYFGKCFKNKYEMTPMEYRKNNLK